MPPKFIVGPSLGGEDARSYLSRKDKSEREPTQHHKDNAEDEVLVCKGQATRRARHQSQ